MPNFHSQLCCIFYSHLFSHISAFSCSCSGNYVAYFIKGLRSTVTAAELKEIFEKHVIIKEIKKINPSNALVFCPNETEASKVLLRNYIIMNISNKFLWRLIVGFA